VQTVPNAQQREEHVLPRRRCARSRAGTEQHVRSAGAKPARSPRRYGPRRHAQTATAGRITTAGSGGTKCTSDTACGRAREL
jgi:hypothetical protein